MGDRYREKFLKLKRKREEYKERKEYQDFLENQKWLERNEKSGALITKYPFKACLLHIIWLITTLSTIAMMAFTICFFHDKIEQDEDEFYLLLVCLIIIPTLMFCCFSYFRGIFFKELSDLSLI